MKSKSSKLQKIWAGISRKQNDRARWSPWVKHVPFLPLSVEHCMRLRAENAAKSGVETCGYKTAKLDAGEYFLAGLS